MTETATQMDLKTCLNLCSGNWFSQRTNYNLGEEKTESGKADLSITMLSAEDSQIAQLCQQHSIDPQTTVGGLFYSWDTSVDWGKPKQQGSSVMVFIPDEENKTKGKLLANTALQLDTQATGTYSIGQDEALTLTIETKDITVEERLWFASDNLRLRTTITKNATGIIKTTFYSEIRKAPPKKE